jgi:signal transduction histidine kinase
MPRRLSDIVVSNPASHKRRPEISGSGHGLVGMRERVAVYGGQFESGLVAGGGFRVRARMPLAAP